MLTGDAMGRPMLGRAGGSCLNSIAIGRDGTLILSGEGDGIVRQLR